MHVIQRHINEITKICETHKVLKLYLFGSCAAGRSHNQSDIDLLVTFNDSIELLYYADNYFSLLEKFEEILQNKVDLVVSTSLKNPVLIANINQSKKLLYESEGSEVSA